MLKHENIELKNVTHKVVCPAITFDVMIYSQTFICMLINLALKPVRSIFSTYFSLYLHLNLQDCHGNGFDVSSPPAVVDLYLPTFQLLVNTCMSISNILREYIVYLSLVFKDCEGPLR